MPWQHVSNAVSLGLHLDHGVCGGDCGIDRLVSLQCLDIGGNDRLRNQWTYGVMEQDIALLIAECGQRARRSLVPSLGTFQDLSDLGVLALLDNGANLVEIAGCHHDHDLVHQR